MWVEGTSGTSNTPPPPLGILHDVSGRATADGFARGGLSFGDLLQGFRTAAGLTQEELAERSGLSPNAVGALERGQRRRPYPHTVRALADGLGLDEKDQASLLAAVPGRTGADRQAEEAPPAAVTPRAAPAALPYPATSLVGRERELGEVADLPVVVFMHHPPAALGNWSDRTRLREHREVGDLLRSHGRVLHILSGHTHRACSGTWRGIAWTVLHGIGPQATLAWGRDVRPDYLDGPAQVAILDIENGDLRVHAVDVSGNARTWRRTG